jgi:hypothetical protein
MWALSNIDIVDGAPAIRAKGLRGLMKRAGHEIWVEESTATRAIVCAHHRDSARIERSTWTIDRAKKAELVGKKNWRLYPTDMLLNRATAEAVRLAAPDVLLGHYTVDELGGDEGPQPIAAPAADDEKPAPAKRRTAQRAKPAPGVEPEAMPVDMPAPPAEREDHLGGELPGTCDLNMPHDIRFTPYGCPPNCPTRLAANQVPAARDEADAVDMLNAAGLQVETLDVLDGMDAPPDGEPARMVSEPQRKRMAVEMRKAGIVDRAERLAFVSHIVGREVQSGNDLTMSEASDVIRAVIEYAETQPGLDAVQPTEGDD